MIQNRVKGQRALVTGAIWYQPESKRSYPAAGAGHGRDSGIGRAVALQLARGGADERGDPVRQIPMSTASMRDDASPRRGAGGHPCCAALPAKRADAVSGEALAAAHGQGHRIAPNADRLGLAGTRATGRHDGTASNPPSVTPDEPPPHSRFAWQARVASP
jgi:hypothetical protein